MTVVVDRLVVAVNAHDLDAVADLVHEDYRSEQPAHPGRAFAGRAQMLANWAAMFAGIPDFHAEICRSVQDGDTTWTEWRWSGTRSDGLAFEMRGVTLFGVTDGQVVAGRLYLEDVERDVMPVSSRPWRTCPVTGRGPRISRTAQRSRQPPIEWPGRASSSARTCRDEVRRSSQMSCRRQMQSRARMPEGVTSAYEVEGASRADAQTYPSPGRRSQSVTDFSEAATRSAVRSGRLSTRWWLRRFSARSASVPS